MAVGLRRKVRLDSRRISQKLTRRGNALRKQDERIRRDVRVKGVLKAQGLNAPAFARSWACAQLDKFWYQVTAQDIQQLVG